MLRGKRKYFFAITIIAALYIFGLWHLNTKLTYLEYTTPNESCDTYITLKTDGEELLQEFTMPYDIFDSIAVRIGTFTHDNNSTWGFKLMDSSGRTLCEDSFNASVIEDNGYFRHKIAHRFVVKKGEKYVFSLAAKDANDSSKLAFYVSDGNSIEGTELIHNGQAVDNTLCFRVYGGNRDYWWHRLLTFILIYILIIVFRFYTDEKNNRSVHKDVVLQGLIVGALSFLLLCSFATNGVFLDENDNMRGGMVIANGGILYRDYVVQHTPVVYYLCSLFALLGAGSIEQFRLSYYILESALWMFLYIRHRNSIGEKKMAILPLLTIVCISSMIMPQGFQILSDGFEGLMFTALMLEFLRYYQDHSLNWDRCIIISICIWGSFGAVFISAFALVFLALIFIGVEISYFTHQKSRIKDIIQRYGKLAIALAVPLISAIVYFKINHTIRIAFEQFYALNREIYPNYTNYGGSIIQPFVKGIQNFFNIFAESFNTIMTATASTNTILQLLPIVLAVGIVIKKLWEKEYVIGLSLGLMTVFSATRGYSFHGLAAWYLTILIVVLYADSLIGKPIKIPKPILGIGAIILFSTYCVAVGDNLLYEQPSISEIESKVVDLTEGDDNKDIFLDAVYCDSLYLYYKDRKPVNRAVYMLPWYMDWYEKWDIEDLTQKKPHVVVYNEDRGTWGRYHYTYAFDNELKKNYSRLGEDDWKYCVWIRNE